MSPTGSGSRRHSVEVRGAADIGGGVVPVEDLPGRDVEAPPIVVADEHVGVAAGEHLRLHALVDHLLDLLGAGPDVPQIHRLPAGVGAEGIVEQVGKHGAGQGVGDHQRRGGEEVHLALGMDAALEVAVARQHRAHRQVVSGHGRADLRDQRAGVADTGGAAVADQRKPELL